MGNHSNRLISDNFAQALRLPEKPFTFQHWCYPLPKTVSGAELLLMTHRGRESRCVSEICKAAQPLRYMGSKLLKALKVIKYHFGLSLEIH